METTHNQENFNTANRKKLSTPSMLFCKQESKSPKVSDSRSTNQKSPYCKSRKRLDFVQHTCQNHKGKKAQFVKEAGGGELYFCQKCAISLASQGHSVVRMRDPSTSSVNPYSAQKQSSRQAEIDGFLSKMRALSSNLSVKKQDIKDKLINSEEFYGEQIEQINDYFELIHQSLELEKNKCYNYILNERKSAEQSIRAVNASIEQLQAQMQRIVLDIEENLETVFGVEEKVYKLVISQYDGQYIEFSGKIQRIEIDPVELRKIEFAGVPESIYSLSDIVIQNNMSQSTKGINYVLIDSENEGMTGGNQKSSSISRAECEQRQGGHSLKKNASSYESLRFSFQGEKIKQMQNLNIESLQSEESLKGYLKMWD